MTTLDQLVQRRGQAMPGLIDRLARGDGLVFQTITKAQGPFARVDGRWVLNFATSDYLGLGQDPRVTAAMAQAAAGGISLGMPRALGAAALTGRLETAIAALVGQERALVFPSTTHIALDVLPLLAGQSGMLFVDERAYPISLDGALVAARVSDRLVRFPHNDPEALERLLRPHWSVQDNVIVCDGIYPLGGRVAALRAFAALAERYGATIYVDDAHGIGILGEEPSAMMPLGFGGGGTPRQLQVGKGSIVHVGGLGKGFGVPVAFVAGPERFIDHVRLTVGTFVHSSPPATPILAAALAALQVHDREGDDLRRHLVALVRRFRNGLRRAGLEPEPASVFPIQSLRLPSSAMATIAASTLRRQGIWPLLQLASPEQPAGGAIRFVLTALHQTADIDEAVAAIARTWHAVQERGNRSNRWSGAFIASA
jgi:8-amino-7-oxononanoate synthase